MLWARQGTPPVRMILAEKVDPGPIWEAILEPFAMKNNLEIDAGVERFRSH